jgi:predicted nucleic acid-binding protein
VLFLRKPRKLLDKLREKMNETVYGTRFFVEFFQTRDENLSHRKKEKKNRKEKYVSSIIIHEVGKFSILQEGKERQRLGLLMKNNFLTVQVDDPIAECSAGLRHKYKLPMGDSMIAATALMLNAICISDDLILNR